MISDELVWFVGLASGTRLVFVGLESTSGPDSGGLSDEVTVDVGVD